MPTYPKPEKVALRKFRRLVTRAAGLPWEPLAYASTDGPNRSARRMNAAITKKLSAKKRKAARRDALRALVKAKKITAPGGRQTQV